jgi:phage terminase small subunit
MDKQLLLPGMPEKEHGELCLPTKKKGKVTAKMMAFVAEYLKTNELAASAIKAGYAPKYAGTIANRLIQKSQVSELIRQEKDAALKRAGVELTRALLEVAKIAYHDPRKLYRADGTLKEPSEWDDDTAAAIAQVEVFESFEGTGNKRRVIGHTKKVRAWDKKAALELLLKHLGALKENIIFPDADGNPQNVAPQTIQVVFVEKAVPLNSPEPDDYGGKGG